MAIWVIETQPPNSELRQAVDLVAALNGPVGDVESVCTDLDLGQGAFGALTQDKRKEMRLRIRRCLTAFFKSLHRSAPLYEAFANAVAKDDVVVSFNYDVSLEAELVRAGRFRVRDG